MIRMGHWGTKANHDLYRLRSPCLTPQNHPKQKLPSRIEEKNPVKGGKPQDDVPGENLRRVFTNQTVAPLPPFSRTSLQCQEKAIIGVNLRGFYLTNHVLAGSRSLQNFPPSGTEPHSAQLLEEDLDRF